MAALRDVSLSGIGSVQVDTRNIKYQLINYSMFTRIKTTYQKCFHIYGFHICQSKTYILLPPCVRLYLNDI